MPRRMIEVTGIVQGVGFRPFVYNLATSHQLCGFVRNESGRVLIEAEGEESALDQFLAKLVAQPPPLACIESVSWKEQAIRGDTRFRIETSETGESGTIYISPDIATCPECLEELFNPDDRRFRYPFLNCTNCGPRLTIITAAPYDRSHTTMSSFPMCAACRVEYDDPGNRRFHAQPTACPICGPQLLLRDRAGRPVPTTDPVNLFAQALLVGKIGTMKGLGGYHLICDARNAVAVAELRRRKHRDEKPFAVMVPDVISAASLCELGPVEQRILQSPQAPIVLLRKRAVNAIADVAPGNPYLGIMLPYTPLHHLLLREVGGIPLVMTSGNRSDEPIVYRDDVVEKLAGIADFFLTHDRPIHVRCDDSVVRVVDDVELPLRRSRGYAPRPLPLPFNCPQPILAVGGQLKVTFAFARDSQAFLSHHLGDLDHFEAFRAFERDVTLFQQLFGMQPKWLVHDLHPDYASTRYAFGQTRQSGISLLGVQHHHAHMASCMTEHGLIGSAIGVTFDGTGYGLDGTVWGGEFLIGSCREFRRAGHLRSVAMPGGDQAIREPWRMALAHLIDAGCGDLFACTGVSQTEERVVRRVLKGALPSPLTSSMGRLFDAVAALSGVRTHVGYEGQAAVELEWLATQTPGSIAYPFDLATEQEGPRPSSVLVVDTRPLIRAIAADVADRIESRVIARRFHTTVVEMVAVVCTRLRAESGLNTVILSGGVFLNALLTHETCSRLEREGFCVFRHRRVPPNDGGLALGQVAIAAAHANGA